LAEPAKRNDLIGEYMGEVGRRPVPVADRYPMLTGGSRKVRGGIVGLAAHFAGRGGPPR